MRKIFLEYSKVLCNYWVLESHQTINFDLKNLWMFFDKTNYWMCINHEEGWVTIWSRWDLKCKKWKDFISQEDKKRYDEAYTKYCRKRGREMPMLEITEQNYEEILQQWEQIKKAKKKYAIISMDDFGWVRIEGKNAFSYQDEQDMKLEHEKYLEYRKKVDAYAPFLRRTNDEWQSPEDEEYYSDFLTEEEMVWRSKRF